MLAYTPLTLQVPTRYVGKVMELCTARRGELMEHSVLGGSSSTPPSSSDTTAADSDAAQHQQGSALDTSAGSGSGWGSSEAAGSPQQQQQGGQAVEAEEGGAGGGEGVGSGGPRSLLRYVLPLSELASDLHSELKSRTQG